MKQSGTPSKQTPSPPFPNPHTSALIHKTQRNTLPTSNLLSIAVQNNPLESDKKVW